METRCTRERGIARLLSQLWFAEYTLRSDLREIYDDIGVRKCSESARLIVGHGPTEAGLRYCREHKRFYGPLCKRRVWRAPAVQGVTVRFD